VQVKTTIKAGAVPSNSGGGGRPGLTVQTGVKGGEIVVTKPTDC